MSKGLKQAKIVRIVKLLARLTGNNVKDLLQSNCFELLDGISPIVVLRSSQTVKITCRKWLAPMRKGIITTLNIPKHSLVMVRITKYHVDIELINADDRSGIYTATIQDWKEKLAWFHVIPENRIKGDLGTVVDTLFTHKKKTRTYNDQRIADAATATDDIKITRDGTRRRRRSDRGTTRARNGSTT